MIALDRGREWSKERQAGISRTDGNIACLDCGNGYPGEYTCQHSSNYTLCILLLLIMLPKVNNKFFKYYVLSKNKTSIYRSKTTQIFVLQKQMIKVYGLSV